ncbi:MAG TPA: hypothetical protein VHG88_08240 [Burkholderiales bacterium]|nr:hypothetical protein [Burkholderiales bacterium]
MQPVNIAVTLRRRSPWEATDLGLAMLQRWWRPVYAVHALVLSLVCALALLLGWAFDAVGLAILAIWWLQPVYDRAVLHVLSRAVFGAVPGPREVLRGAREWLGTGLLRALTLDRLDLARSFNLPVRQLEGQRGREARARRSLLGKRARGHAVWLTVVWVHFEAVLLWSAGALSQVLLPAQLERQRGDEVPFFGGFFDWVTTASVGDGLVFAAVWLLLEPFYVAAGFALYLNRRTLLEGWDIEVALRRIAERHAVAILMSLTFAFSLVPGIADAQEQTKDPKTEIAEVLKAREFGHYRDAMRWQVRASDNPEEGSGSFWEAFWKWLLGDGSKDDDTGSGIGYALAKALQVLFWALVAAAAAYLLWQALKLLPRMAAPPREPYRPPAALFGMELAPDKLPADVAEAAAALAAEGRLREALSLLYRGALSELVHKRGVQLLASHTEGEAVRLAGMPYFAALVDLWRACAYAKRELSPARVQELAAGYKDAFA